MRKKSFKNRFAVIDCRLWVDGYGNEYYTEGIAIWDTKEGHVVDFWVTDKEYGGNYDFTANHELTEHGYKGLKYSLTKRYVLKKELHIKF